ncbi:zf-C2H2 Zinc finger, C2H2 type [Mortierella antarctica]|nr:zf-C2H2 Zinc finger, C2H2 type [Mortierella antarctica]
MSYSMSYKFPKGHGKPKRNQEADERSQNADERNHKADERHETMPSHTEDNMDNYDCFDSPSQERPTYAEYTGLAGLAASFYHNGRFPELRLESEIDFHHSLNYGAIFDDPKFSAVMDSYAVETTGTEDDAIQLLDQADSAAPAQGDLTAITIGITKSFVPGLSADHAASQDHENRSGAQNLLPETKAGHIDPSLSLTSDCLAASSQAIPAGFTSCPGTTSPPGPAYVRLADVAVSVPELERMPSPNPIRAPTSKKKDRRRRRSSLTELAPQQPKFLKGDHGKILNKDTITSQPGLQNSSSGGPVNPSLPAASVKASNLGQDSGSGAKYQCRICQKICRDNHNLQEHLSKHTGKKSDWCIFAGCNKATSRIRDMARHILDRHTNVKSFICPHCLKAYTRADGLKTHVKNKHPKNLL